MKIIHGIDPSRIKDPTERRFWEINRSNWYEVDRAVAFSIAQGNSPESTATSGETDHGALDGLSDDDHAQYLLLAGRAPSQVVLSVATNNVPLTVRGVAGQTSSLFRAQKAPSTDLVTISCDGYVTVPKLILEDNLLSPSAGGSIFGGDYNYSLDALIITSGDSGYAQKPIVLAASVVDLAGDAVGTGNALRFRPTGNGYDTSKALTIYPVQFTNAHSWYLPLTNASGVLTNNGSGTLTWTAPAGGITGLASPSATVGLTATNGTATTAMRSDAAPALSESIAPTWTGIHTYTTSPIFENAFYIREIGTSNTIRFRAPSSLTTQDWILPAAPAGSGSQFTYLRGVTAGGVTGLVWSSTMMTGPGGTPGLVLFQDYADPTKQLALDISNIPTGTTRTLGISDAGSDGTIALLEAPNVFTAIQEVAATLVVSAGDINLSGKLNISAAGWIDINSLVKLVSTGGPTALRTFTFPDYSGQIAVITDIPTVDSIRTWGTVQTFPSGGLALSDGTGNVTFNVGAVSGNRSWTIPDVSGEPVLGAAAVSSPVRGDVLVANSTPAWTRKARGTSGDVFVMSGSDPVWGTSIGNTVSITTKDANHTLQNSADTTKQLVESVADITTGTTRTQSRPDYTGTVLVEGNEDITGFGGAASAGRVGKINVVNGAISGGGGFASTKLANAPKAGMYSIVTYAVVRSALSGTLTITIGFTDNQQAQTFAQTIVAAAGSVITNSIRNIYVASGDVTVVGTGPTSGNIDLFVRMIPLP